MTPRLLLNFDDLKALGWPYSPTQTKRLEESGDFPESTKLFPHIKNSRRVWPAEIIMAFFKSKGLLTDDAPL